MIRSSMSNKKMIQDFETRKGAEEQFDKSQHGHNALGPEMLCTNEDDVEVEVEAKQNAYRPRMDMH